MSSLSNTRACGAVSAVLAFLLSSPVSSAMAGDPILIGLDADMSSATAQGGEAIRRGAEVAINEINARGGVLGQQLKLSVSDHRGNPARGKDNLLTFAGMAGLVAVIGGVHTPVALAELNLIHRHRLIYLGAWAAGTPVVDNGYNPNFVFRISVRDEFAGGFLLRSAIRRGFSSPGLLLERTGWGRSNRKAFVAAARKHRITLAGIQWFNWGVRNLDTQIAALRAAGADTVMLVSNPSEGAKAIETMARLPKAHRLPIISHWGITGGNFPKIVGDNLHRVDLSFLQTYSFIRPPHPKRAAQFLKRYLQRYPDTRSARELRSPVGTAHAYDLVHLLALAIKRAKTIDRNAVRKSLERLPRHRGLVRDYAPAFTPKRHDGLTDDDFTIARYDRDGAIVPLTE